MSVHLPSVLDVFLGWWIILSTGLSVHFIVTFIRLVHVQGIKELSSWLSLILDDSQLRSGTG